MMAEEVDIATGLAFLHADLPGKPSKPQPIFEPVLTGGSTLALLSSVFTPKLRIDRIIAKAELEKWPMLGMET